MKFRTIVADPPWRYEQSRIVTTSNKPETKPEAKSQYPTMSVEEICALDVEGVAADDAHLYLWTTNPILPRAFEVVEAWGFTYRTLLTWRKQGTMGMGYYFRGETEHVLFATRGKLPIAPEKRIRNWFEAPRVGHSVKPDLFLDLVEQVSPEPRLEMFARRARLTGWDYWGNESLSTAEVAV